MRVLRKVLILVALVMFLGVAGFLVYFLGLGGLERSIVGVINGAIGTDSPFRVQIGNVKGSLLSGVVVEDVVVAYSDSLLDFQVLSVPRATASYSLANLWDKRYLFGSVTIDDPRVTVRKDGQGHWLVPLPGAGKEDSRQPLLVNIDRLTINRAGVSLIRPRDTLVIADISLWASLKAEDRTYAAEIRQLDFTTLLLGDGPTSLSGKLTLADDNLVFQDIQVIREPMRIKTSGNFNVGQLTCDAELAADNVDLAEISRLAGIKLAGLMDLNGRVDYSQGEWGGHVNLGGNLLFANFENLYADFQFADGRLLLDTLYGTILDNCGIDGTGEIDFTTAPETYRLVADIKNFDLTRLVRGSFTSDLSGSIALDGRSFSSAEMLLSLDVDISESSFDDYPLHRAIGSMEITSEYVRFPDAFSIDYFENSFHTIGVVHYNDDLHLEIEADLPNLDRYRGKLFIDQPGGRGRARATLSGLSGDPDLSGWFASDSLWLYGLYADSWHSDFSIDRFLSGRRGEVSIDVFNGNAWRVPYDTGRGIVRLDSQLVMIDTVSFTSEHAAVSSRGILDQGTYPWRLALDTIVLSVLGRDFYNRAGVVVNIDSAGFEFARASIGKRAASLNMNGRLDYDESMDLRLAVADIPIAPWLHLFAPELAMDGYLSCTARLGGTFADPTIILGGMIDSVAYRDLPLGDLAVSADYRDRLLTIDSLLVYSHPGIYRAAGSMNVDLAFTADEVDRLPNLPFDLKITAEDNRFDLVSLFLPSVEDLKGDFFADFTLAGTPTEPHLDGEAYIKNARLKYFDLVDTVKADSVGVTMEDNRINVDDIEVYVYDKRKKRNSYATIDGILTVKSLDTLHYDLDVSLVEEFPFRYELDDIESVLEGDLRVLGNTPPLVTGDLTLISTKWRAEFGTGEEGSPLMMALSGENTWDLNLNIDVLSNYWIKNQDIDAEFSGFMNLIREQGRYRFIGELEMLRGKGFLFDKTFRIEPDSRVTFEDIDYPNPRLDIIATTRIPIVHFEEEEQRSEEATLAIHVTGTLENPEFNTVEGDSTFTRADILPLILANYYGSESAGAGRFEERISQLISSQVSQIGTRQLGVETFEIDPTYEGEFDIRRTRVTLGVYTSSNLYLYGRPIVSFEKDPELGFQYRFNKWSLFEGRRDEEELYHLNLKLHWEF